MNIRDHANLVGCLNTCGHWAHTIDSVIVMHCKMFDGQWSKLHLIECYLFICLLFNNAKLQTVFLLLLLLVLFDFGVDLRLRKVVRLDTMHTNACKKYQFLNKLGLARAICTKYFFNVFEKEDDDAHTFRLAITKGKALIQNAVYVCMHDSYCSQRWMNRIVYEQLAQFAF